MTKKIIRTGILFLALLCQIHAQTPNLDWPQLDGFSERTGYIETDMKPPFQVKKEINIDENIEDFSYVDGVLYFAFIGTIGRAFGAVELSSGDVLWKRAIPNGVGAVGCLPSVSDDLVYAGAQRGSGLYALNKMTGDSVWLYPTESQYGRNFAIKGDKLFFHPSGKGLICLDKATGEEQWTFGSASTQTVPLVDDENVYTTTRRNDTIYALNHDGVIQWKYSPLSDITDVDAMLSKGDTIFIKTRRQLFAIDRERGSEIWTTTLPDTFNFISTINALTWTPNALVNHEWDGSWQGEFKIQGFDMNTGNMLWSQDLGVNSKVPAVGFGDYLVNVSDGDLQFRQSSDGQLIQEITGLDLYLFSRPKVVDGQIFTVRNNTIFILEPLSTSQKDIDQNDIAFSILENPVNDILRFNLTWTMTAFKWTVIDNKGIPTALFGQITDNASSRHTVPIHSLPSGQYFLCISSSGEQECLPFVLIRN